MPWRRLRRLMPIVFLFLGGSGMAAAGVPHRVVSLNVCTDQIAMLLAGKGQLYSVSWLAADPNDSALAGEARHYVLNHASAEEVFLMAPDLVLAGTYTDQATVQLLRRLGIRVEQFAPARSFADIRAQISRIGNLLGRDEQAAALNSRMASRLAALRARKAPPATVALYYANSYTSGTGTLVDAAVRAAGLTNVADTLGVAGTAKLPLEELVLADPDIIVTSGADYAAPSMATQDYANPAFRALAAGKRTVSIPARDTICGTPFILKAVRMMQDAALASARAPK